MVSVSVLEGSLLTGEAESMPGLYPRAGAVGGAAPRPCWGISGEHDGPGGARGTGSKTRSSCGIVNLV